MRVFISGLKDPYKNLQWEEHLLKQQHLSPGLLLWVNDPCLVWGRFQNPWLECNLKQARQDSISMVRRSSGGGCVYHDSGNLNFSFIFPRSGNKDKVKKDFHESVVRVLTGFGLKAWRNERGDILIDDFKISGSASKETKEQVCFHGTLLVHAQLDRLGNYLTPGHWTSGIITKASASKRAVVANIRDFHPTLGISQLIEGFIENFSPVSVEREYLDEIPEKNNRFLSWEWNFGETPAFEFSNQIVLEEGLDLDCSFQIRHGLITEMELVTQVMHRGICQEIGHKLSGRHWKKSSFLETFSVLREQYPFYSQELDKILMIISDWVVI